MLSMRFGYKSPFSDRLLEDLENPYRRALLVESLGIQSPSEQILSDHLPDLLVELADRVGTSIVNVWLKRPIKHLLLRKKKKDNTMDVPDGMGGMRKVKVLN